jgi:hypothetical protein
MSFKHNHYLREILLNKSKSMEQIEIIAYLYQLGIQYKN